MATDSTTAGFLLPEPLSVAGPAPIDGDDLEDFLQAMVAGVTGMDGTLVRPRWQPEPPNLPPNGANGVGTDWAAAGIVTRHPIGTWAAVVHVPDADGGLGADLMQRHEELEYLVSFYGPNADSNADLLHSGLMVWQNYSALRLQGLAFVEARDAQRVPELVKQQWLNRVDKMVILRRIILRQYAVRTIVEAAGTLTAQEENQTPVTTGFDTDFEPPTLPPGKL